jgi:hypothetical protein
MVKRRMDRLGEPGCLEAGDGCWNIGVLVIVMCAGREDGYWKCVYLGNRGDQATTGASEVIRRWRIESRFSRVYRIRIDRLLVILVEP